MNKTAATVLQEMMVKLGTMPDYECVAQSGPQHSAMFEYRCFALGNTVRAAARSKKEAKQEAARAMLACLAAQGAAVPPPFRHLPPPPPLPGPGPSADALEGGASAGGGGGGGGGGGSARSHVVLLRDLCEQYQLPAPQYELVGDTGPPHARQFTLRAAVARHERRATATTKKLARQLAAEQLYLYLRENLARLTKDYVEEEALARAHERAMERYVELREEGDWRPDLGQKIADYHLGLLTHIDEDKRNAAMEMLAASPAGDEAPVEAVAAALGLTAAWGALPCTGGGELVLLELAPASPALTFAGRSRPRAAAAAARYLRRALALRVSVSVCAGVRARAPPADTGTATATASAGAAPTTE